MSAALGEDDDFIPGRASSELIDHPYRFNIFFFPYRVRSYLAHCKNQSVLTLPQSPPFPSLPIHFTS